MYDSNLSYDTNRIRRRFKRRYKCDQEDMPLIGAFLEATIRTILVKVWEIVENNNQNMKNPKIMAHHIEEAVTSNQELKVLLGDSLQIIQDTLPPTTNIPIMDRTDYLAITLKALRSKKETQEDYKEDEDSEDDYTENE